MHWIIVTRIKALDSGWHQFVVEVGAPSALPAAYGVPSALPAPAGAATVAGSPHPGIHQTHAAGAATVAGSPRPEILLARLHTPGCTRQNWS